MAKRRSRRDIKEQTLYVPYSEDVIASVWAVDAGLQIFSNVAEGLAQENAVEYEKTHIYFFAELSTETSEEDQIVHRDAGSGRFVTEEFADDNPETTVTENDR